MVVLLVFKDDPNLLMQTYSRPLRCQRTHKSHRQRDNKGWKDPLANHVRNIIIPARPPPLRFRAELVQKQPAYPLITAGHISNSSSLLPLFVLFSFVTLIRSLLYPSCLYDAPCPLLETPLPPQNNDYHKCSGISVPLPRPKKKSKMHTF